MINVVINKSFLNFILKQIRRYYVDAKISKLRREALI